MTERRLASEPDVAAVTAAMVTAFATDPVWGEYSFPEVVRNSEASWPFWEFCVRAEMRLHATFVTPGREAAAVWIPPGEAEMTAEQEDGLAELLAELLGSEQARVVMDAFERLDAAHPHDEPHHYLSLLATHRDHRGRGLGMGLLGACLESIDAERMPAYLESTNPMNDARYIRYGFEPTGRVTLPNGTPITTMWRPAGE
jgi:ribosomal protein S18 acetylase RimI-like enzyme